MEGHKDGKDELGNNLQTLADEVHIPIFFLENVKLLLEDKLQVIFQGPPGTGKTYVAQKLAEHLAGSHERSRWSSSTRPTPTRTSCRVSVPPS